jgi:sporulation protein YlmC with PRC-barrel domain
LKNIKVDKIDDNLGNGTKFNDFTGKTVLTIKGMEVGKVTDMAIDPKGCLIHNIIVTSGNDL